MKSDKGIRKRLLPELTNANKKAVSERLNINRSHFYYKSQRGLNLKISRDVIVSVVDFYRRSDIQITYPNKTKNGQPMLVLKYSRKRTYHIFLEEKPGCTSSKTTFDKLKPKALKLMKHAKWLQCICGVCDNISMVCRAIRLSMYRSNMEVPTQLNSELRLAKHAVCDFGNYECLDRKCDGCSVSKLSGLSAEWVSNNPSELIRYHRWKTVTEIVGGKTVSKLQKVESTGQRWMLYNELDKDLQTFPLHLFNAISQLSAFKKCKQSLKSNQVVVVADFAENYKCRQWSEEQACYYVRNSVTLHPLVIVFSEGSEVKRDSVVILSDDLSHDHAA